MLFGCIIENGSILSMKTDDIIVTFTKGILRPEHYHVGINDLFQRLVFLFNLKFHTEGVETI